MIPSAPTVKNASEAGSITAIKFLPSSLIPVLAVYTSIKSVTFTLITLEPASTLKVNTKNVPVVASPIGSSSEAPYNSTDCNITSFIKSEAGIDAISVEFLPISFNPSAVLQVRLMLANKPSAA